ncbi:unnamed protein product [Didymodactylos carnosus]|uniref:Uncharacterized protein n=1 Tax=Didymodactylos carnosus TaxID=1234261 RepID=A0A815WV62_9BILA|nr:unnamed protein product [Didymodactylos carnosus]CAF4409988.1 unnamed protein product [Didymodactylos carnosus]
MSTTVTTSTTTVTTTAIKPETARKQGLQLKDITEFVNSVSGLLTALGAIFTSVLCWCSIKCYRNGGECKRAWWCPKSLKEYRRRQHTVRVATIDLSPDN